MEAAAPIFDATPWELAIPKDRFGNKATKLAVSFTKWEPRLTIEDDLNLFNSLEIGDYAELTIRVYVESAPELPSISEDGERTIDVRKGVRVLSVERAG